MQRAFILRLLKELLIFVTNRPAAEKALSDSTDVGGTDFKPLYSPAIDFVRIFVDSKTLTS